MSEAVAALEPLLRAAPPHVQGVSIKANAGVYSQLYAKWKAPAHEEQQLCPTLVELAVLHELAAAAAVFKGKVDQYRS
eukprot:jgi/Tetstr1/456495/TSEL_043218.t1